MSARPTAAEKATALKLANRFAAPGCEEFGANLIADALAAARATAAQATRSCVPQGVSVEATPFGSEPEPFGRAVLCWSGKIHQSEAGEVGFWYEREGSTAQAAALARELDVDGSDATCGPHVGIALYLLEPEAARLLRIAERRIASLKATVLATWARLSNGPAPAPCEWPTSGHLCPGCGATEPVCCDTPPRTGGAK